MIFLHIIYGRLILLPVFRFLHFGKWQGTVHFSLLKRQLRHLRLLYLSLYLGTLRQLPPRSALLPPEPKHRGTGGCVFTRTGIKEGLYCKGRTGTRQGTAIRAAVTPRLRRAALHSCRLTEPGKEPASVQHSPGRGSPAPPRPTPPDPDNGRVSALRPGTPAGSRERDVSSRLREAVPAERSSSAETAPPGRPPAAAAATHGSRGRGGAASALPPTARSEGR